MSIALLQRAETSTSLRDNSKSIKLYYLVAQISTVTVEIGVVALPKVFDGVTVVGLVAYIQVLTVFSSISPSEHFRSLSNSALKFIPICLAKCSLG